MAGSAFCADRVSVLLLTIDVMSDSCSDLRQLKHLPSLNCLHILIMVTYTRLPEYQSHGIEVVETQLQLHSTEASAHAVKLDDVRGETVRRVRLYCSAMNDFVCYTAPHHIPT